MTNHHSITLNLVGFTVELSSIEASDNTTDINPEKNNIPCIVSLFLLCLCNCRHYISILFSCQVFLIFGIIDVYHPKILGCPLIIPIT